MLTAAKLQDGTPIPVGQAYPVNFKQEGTLATGGSDFIIRPPGLFQLQKVIGTITTAADQDIIVDVLVNAVTVFPAVGNRLTIAAAALTGETSVIVATSVARAITDGDVVTINVTQVGTGGNEGENLSVQLLGNVSIP